MTAPTRIRLQRAVMAVLFASACGDSVSEDAASIIERRISPTAANSSITNFTPDHFVWLDPDAPASRLVVFLSGTLGVPGAYRFIGQVAAEQGARVIGLMYPNESGVVFVCSPDPNPACMESLRHEIVEGGNYSSLVEVDAANSIVGRLVDLLKLLAREHPTEGWDAFLNGNTPKWDAITVAGHSQGGGHAAYIAKTRTVNRVVMLGAPADGFDGQPAPWMQIGATPADRYYGFRHARDQFTSITPNWLALGLDQFGAQRTVDATATNFGGSHMLVTDQLPGTGSYNESHSSVAADGATPLTASGAPAFATIWRYLFGN